jgi:nucleoside-diphosphate-sugar epimerase
MAGVLVFGLSGQVGDALRARSDAFAQPVLAVSRTPQPDSPGVAWLRGDLQNPPELPWRPDTIVSLGPLDHFARWFAATETGPVRVVALGSTGRVDKRASPDAAERALAARLEAAEATLFAAAKDRGAGATVLRPTMLYGGGRDRTLAPVVRFARRVGLVPLPWGARGLRQPVHVDDVAGAVLACLRAPGTSGRAFDLPGGERLRFDHMLRRALDAHAPRARILRLPPALFGVLRRLPGVGDAVPEPGAIARLAQDQVADPGPAVAAWGYAPRPFQPWVPADAAAQHERTIR